MIDSTGLARLGARHTLTVFLLTAILSLVAFAAAPQWAFAERDGGGSGQQEEGGDSTENKEDDGGNGEGDNEDAGDLDDAADAVKDLTSDAVPFVEVLAMLGLMLGLAMFALGQRSGLMIMGFAAFSGLIFLIGEGVIEVFWD